MLIKLFQVVFCVCISYMTVFNKADWGGGYKEKQKHFNNNNPVKLSANKTGNDRKEEKTRRRLREG